MKKTLLMTFAAFAFCMVANAEVRTGYAELDSLGGDKEVVIDAWGAVSNEVNAVVADKAWLTVSNDVMTAIKRKSWGAVYHSMTNWVTQELNAKITEKDAWAEVEDNVYLAISQRAWSAVSQNIIATLQNMFDEQFGDREGVSKEYVSAMITSSYANLYRQLWELYYGYGYDFYVDAVNGSDRNNGLNPQAAFKTIDAALDALKKVGVDSGLPDIEATELIATKKIAVMAGEYSYPTNINQRYSPIPFNLIGIQGREKTIIKAGEGSSDNSVGYGIHGTDFENGVRCFLRGFTIEGFNQKGCYRSITTGLGSMFGCVFYDCSFKTDMRETAIRDGYLDDSYVPFANCEFYKCSFSGGYYKFYFGNYSQPSTARLVMFFACVLNECEINNNTILCGGGNPEINYLSPKNGVEYFYWCDVVNSRIVIEDPLVRFARGSASNWKANLENSVFLLKGGMMQALSNLSKITSSVYLRNCIIATPDGVDFITPATSTTYRKNIYFGTVNRVEELLSMPQYESDYSEIFGYLDSSETAVRNWVYGQNYQNEEGLRIATYDSGERFRVIANSSGKLMLFRETPSVSAARSAEIFKRNLENKQFHTELKPYDTIVVPNKIVVKPEGDEEDEDEDA